MAGSTPRTEMKATTFPRDCASCRQRLFGHVAFCPYCGQPASVIFSDAPVSAEPPAHLLRPRKDAPAQGESPAPPLTTRPVAPPVTPATPKISAASAAPPIPSGPITAQRDPVEPSRATGFGGKWIFILAGCSLAAFIGVKLYVSSEGRQFDQLNQAAVEAESRGDLLTASHIVQQMKAMHFRDAEVVSFADGIEAARKRATTTLRSAQDKLRSKNLQDVRSLLDGAEKLDNKVLGLSAARANLDKLENQRDHAMAAFKLCIQAENMDCAQRQAEAIHSADASVSMHGELRALDEKLAARVAAILPPVVDGAPSAAAEAARPSALPVPPPTGGLQVPTPSSAQMAQAICVRLVQAGNRALAGQRYDQAMANARDALAQVSTCPGAARLFVEARKARDDARQR